MYEPFKNIHVGKPLKHVTRLLDYPTISLDMLYENGWWITEIFGTKAIIVRKATKFSKTSPTFYCATVHINMDQMTPAAEKLIKKIANKQWNKYKYRMLTYKTKNYRIYL